MKVGGKRGSLFHPTSRTAQPAAVLRSHPKPR